MDLASELWTLAEAEQLHKTVKRIILEVQGVGKYTSEAQNFELQFAAPLGEILAASENLLIEKRREACGINADPSFTKPLLF